MALVTVLPQHEQPIAPLLLELSQPNMPMPQPRQPDISIPLPLRADEANVIMPHDIETVDMEVEMEAETETYEELEGGGEAVDSTIEWVNGSGFH
jgi:hypothetical protein